MGDRTGISWTDATWNPVRGCSRISEGCRNCYAERVAARFSKPGQPYHGFAQVIAPRDLLDKVGGRRDGWTRKVALVVEHLADPLRWRKPRRIFTASMGDVFHESLANDEIAAIFGVMAVASWHTFQVLTKRAARMKNWHTWIACESKRREMSEIDVCLSEAYARLGDPEGPSAIEAALERASRKKRPSMWPLPNVWVGTSVENQAAADERIPELLAMPAAVRFLSCEPLLGPVALREEWMLGTFIECPDENRGDEVDPCAGCPAVPNDGARGGDYCGAVRGPRITWLIAGCESGHGARPCDIEWLRSLRDQCAAAAVSFWLKQAKMGGTTADAASWMAGRSRMPGIWEGPGSKRKAGGVVELPYLDGRQHVEMPGADHG